MAQNFFLKEPAPTKVQVVNDPENPTKTEVINLPIQQGSVFVRCSNSVSVLTFRPQLSNFNITLDNILLLQGDGTFAPIPLCSSFTNMTPTSIDNMLASYKTSYAILVSGVSAATLHYSKMSSTGVVTSEVYNLKD